MSDQQVLATAIGPVRGLLSAERVILNCVQRMSAISTKTARLIERMQPSQTRLCDTRKTAPGLRMLDKYAVRVGGGYNHRTGLYDAVMLKDNHLAYAGSIMAAVAQLRERLGHTVKIEVEIETLEQLMEAAPCKVKVKHDVVTRRNHGLTNSREELIPAKAKSTSCCRPTSADTAQKTLRSFQTRRTRPRTPVVSSVLCSRSPSAGSGPMLPPS